MNERISGLGTYTGEKSYPLWAETLWTTQFDKDKGTKYCLIVSSEEGLGLAEKHDIDALHRRFDQLERGMAGTKYFTGKVAEEEMVVQSDEPLLILGPHQRKPSVMTTVRILSLMASSVLAGILVASAFGIAGLSFHSRLYLFALGIPPFGVATACTLVLMKGEEYDEEGS